MIRLILPTVQSSGQRYTDAARRIVEFRAAHPELGELEAAASDAMQANNEAVLPMWNLLNRLRESDPEKHEAWCDFLNGRGPQP